MRKWLAPVLVVAVAALTRFWNLGYPHSLVYDENFYVKDAYTMLRLGYAGSWPKGADAKFDAGHYNIFSATAEKVSHPPLGKWIISLGIRTLGVQNAASWRVMDAIAGVLAVVLLIAIATKLFHSLPFGTIAGGLFAIDGSAIVMSRVGMLDNFVMLFALAGFGAILLDRDWATRRLDRWLERRRADGRNLRWGPSLWWRPWMIAAGIGFGLSGAVKWNGFIFAFAYALYSLIVEIRARKQAGIELWHIGTILKQGPATFVLTVVSAFVVYMLTGLGWFITSGGLFRHWADERGHAFTGFFAWIPHTLQSYLHLQEYELSFGVSFDAKGPYTSPASDWLFMIRPISMFSNYFAKGQDGCDSVSCTTTINAVSNPLIWYGAVVALFVLLFMVFFRRNWRAAFILVGVAAGYLPWVILPRPTVFQYYTIAFEPMMILALVMVLQLAWMGRTWTVRRRKVARIAVVVFLVASVLLSIYFLPLWIALQEPSTFITSHYWLPSWG